MNELKVFLDTNILFDYLSGRVPFYAPARNLAIMSAFGDIRLFVSGKSFTDIFYVMKRLTDPKNIQDLFVSCMYLVDVCSLEKEDIEAACKLGWDDFEDALIAASATKVGADYLVTRDSAFPKFNIPVCTPEEVGELFKARGISYAEVNLNDIDLDEI